ncbi:MAG: ABC transporter ATP-binding protein [Crocinitomicaceae bacterium]|nr:ABC transporter ATP-binding protein [Crocinitomicaceae bacterium]|tara:strand:+ start:7884 stop:8807 length:924 start_codon:yes stop_codon:yes gene_type:complete
MPRKNIIELNGVNKSYQNFKALNNLNLKIPKGKIFGLLGPNGAGKTTLIRILNQILIPDSGEVLFNGEKLNQKNIINIGYLPEERGLYRKMKIGNQAMYLAQLKGLSKKEAKDRLDYWFDKFEISNWWNKKIEDLSKGMAQKIQFIVTILHDPDLLILDEPFSGLDPVNSKLIKKEIQELKKKKTTIILSTHDMNSVEEICDEAAIIHNSNKILQGKVSDLKDQFQTNQWKISYKGSNMAFTNAIWGGWKLISHETINDINTAIIELNEKLSMNDFLKGIIEKISIIEVKKNTPSMQDVFLKATTNE